VPIDRLDEQPEKRALLVDLTCDSDGKVSHYVSTRDNRFLPVHPTVNGTPYYVGFFLMGAYEDIIGDAHNLFGRVTEAHVYADAEEPGDIRERVGQRVNAVGDDTDGAREIAEDQLRNRNGEVQEENLEQDGGDGLVARTLGHARRSRE